LAADIEYRLGTESPPCQVEDKLRARILLDVRVVAES
jgi:hypothetical protein